MIKNELLPIQQGGGVSGCGLRHGRISVKLIRDYEQAVNLQQD